MKAKDMVEEARAIALACANWSGLWTTAQVCGAMGSLKGSVIVRALIEAGAVEKVHQKDRLTFYRTLNVKMLQDIAQGLIPVPVFTGNIHHAAPRCEAKTALDVLGYGKLPQKVKGTRYEVKNTNGDTGRPLELPRSGTFLEMNT